MEPYDKTYSSLGQRVKAQYPGAYDDLDDVALGAKVIKKYPDYRDFAAINPPQEEPSVVDYMLGKSDQIPSALQGIIGDLAKRQENLSQAVGRQTNKQQTVVETGLQAAGQGAGAVADAGGRLLSAIIPESVKKGGMKVVSSVLGQQGIEAAQNGMDAYRAWKEKNPRFASNLESVVNIATLVPATKAIDVTGRAGAKAIQTTAGIVSDVAKTATAPIAQSFAERASQSLLKKTVDLVRPVLNKKDKIAALAAGQGERKGIFRSIQVAPSPRDNEVAKAALGIVNPKKNELDNIKLLRNEVTGINQQIKTQIRSSDMPYNEAQLKTALDRAKDQSRVIFGSDSTLESRYDAIRDELVRNVEKKNLSGLFEARQKFDGIVQSKFPRVFDGTPGDNVVKNAVLDVRRTANDFIAQNLPAGNKLKESLRKEHLLLEAVENLAEKAAPKVGTNMIQRLFGAAKRNPIVAATFGSSLGAGALGALFNRDK